MIDPMWQKEESLTVNFFIQQIHMLAPRKHNVAFSVGYLRKILLFLRGVHMKIPRKKPQVDPEDEYSNIELQIWDQLNSWDENTLMDVITKLEYKISIREQLIKKLLHLENYHAHGQCVHDRTNQENKVLVTVSETKIPNPNAAQMSLSSDSINMNNTKSTENCPISSVRCKEEIRKRWMASYCRRK